MPVIAEGRVRGVVTARDVGEILEFKGLVQSPPRAGRRSA
jgi:hypothetical protein